VPHPEVSFPAANQPSSHYHLCLYANTHHLFFLGTNDLRGSIAQSQYPVTYGLINSNYVLEWNGFQTSEFVAKSVHLCHFINKLTANFNRSAAGPFILWFFAFVWFESVFGRGVRSQDSLTYWDLHSVQGQRSERLEQWWDGAVSLDQFPMVGWVERRIAPGFQEWLQEVGRIRFLEAGREESHRPQTRLVSAIQSKLAIYRAQGTIS
jgi:hypothetical protein